MGLLENINGWTAVFGGLSGIAVLVYFGLMIHYTRRKDDREQRIEVQLARIEGLLLGRRRL